MNAERGTAIIKQALRAPEWQSREAQQKLAWKVGVGCYALEAFAYGRAALGRDALQALTRELWHGKLEFDPRYNELTYAKHKEAAP